MKDQAEKLARECAFEAGHSIKIERELTPPDSWLVMWDHKKLADLILYKIPLLELLEVARAAKVVSDDFDISHEGSELCDKCCLSKALQSLSNKGIEL